MKRYFLLFLLSVGAAFAQAAKIDLGSHGKLTLYLEDGWKVETADYGDRRLITISPKGDANAGCTLTITFPETDRLDTKSRLKNRVESDGEKFADQSVEGRAVAKEFGVHAGYGFYCNFTDPELVGKPPQPGNFKTMTAGRIHVAPDVMIEVNITADGFSSDPYQQLLGTVEGMDYDPGTGK
jgi:hypothetical protein